MRFVMIVGSMAIQASQGFKHYVVSNGTCAGNDSYHCRACLFSQRKVVLSEHPLA